MCFEWQIRISLCKYLPRKNISIISKIFIKKNLNSNKIRGSGIYNIITLLPSPFEPQLYTPLENLTFVTENSITRYKHDYWLWSRDCFIQHNFYHSQSMYIFLNKNSLQTQMFNFIPRDCMDNHTTLSIIFFKERKVFYISLKKTPGQVFFLAYLFMNRFW